MNTTETPILAFAGHSDGSLISGTLSATAVLMAFVVNATVAADVGRFLPPSSRRAGAISMGIVLQLVSFFGTTLIGAWFSYRLGTPQDPGTYFVDLLGPWGVVLVTVTQFRINAINAYAGSLALSNFFARTVSFI